MLFPVKNSDKANLEKELGRMLTNEEYKSIVNSVTSISENLEKIDLGSLLSPSESDVKPKKSSSGVPSSGVSSSGVSSSGVPSGTRSRSGVQSGTRSRSGSLSSVSTEYSNVFEDEDDERSVMSVVTDESKQKYLKYKAKYLALKKKLNN